MGTTRIGNSVTVAACFASFVAAQDQAETCYGPGSVVGAVVGTLIVTLGLLLCGLFLYKSYWKHRKGKHLMLMADSENPHDQYAFDNPCFREATPIKHGIRDEKENLKPEKTKWPGWPPVHTFGKERKSEKLTSLDDSYVNDARLKVVNLKSHDFTGLGFNICGNMRDGIFVKDVLHRGPAFESGCINTGDRIDSVCISFRNMVFEDALTILSYASPYDVQVQVENDSCSRPSTLMRRKRESNALKNSSDRILHPKFNRSQSFSHVKEMDKSNNVILTHQTDFLLEKNRINHSLTKSQNFTEYPTIKVSSQERDEKTQRSVVLKASSVLREEKSSKIDTQNKDSQFRQTRSAEPQNKLQKFGIRVLPATLSPKSGMRPEAATKGPVKSQTTSEEELPEKGVRGAFPVAGTVSRFDENDTGKENVKAKFSKGLLNLKEKISQNGLGKKRKGGEESSVVEEARDDLPEWSKREREGDFPLPKLRSSVASGGKAQEQNHHSDVPEEVSRAGDVARSNRKSVSEARKSIFRSPEHEDVDWTVKMERGSDSEGSSDEGSIRDDSKRLKRSKGRAPAPPKQATTSKEIKKESGQPKESVRSSKSVSDSKLTETRAETEFRSLKPKYESDSDAEAPAAPEVNTKIELNTTQVTVHQSSAGDANDDDVEPNRKAASLGDLSRLDSERPLSVVLERAVSLDLTEGTSQCGKKRKAPLPPSEEFTPGFDDLNCRKETRLEGLNTFQRRLKKSSDFGTLEDALCEGPKSLEIETTGHSPINLADTHNYNIQEFSSWLAECRKPKPMEEPVKTNREEPKTNSTSLININSSSPINLEKEVEEVREYQGGNVSFSVNGKNLAEISSSSEKANLPGANSRTVVVISRSDSLETAPPENVPIGDDESRPRAAEDTVTPPKLPTSPMPASGALSSPLSSMLTYITEIKVSTSDRGGGSDPEMPSPNFVGERIQKFDSPKSFECPPGRSGDSSRIPVRTMKSETGQKILATIQSLAKESSPTKPPEVEYSKRMASLFSSPQIRKDEATEGEVARDNAPAPIPKTFPLRPSREFSPPRKVPPVVPPRKTETSLVSRSTVTVELPPPGGDSLERNVMTSPSFMGKSGSDESGALQRTSFKVEERIGINGGKEGEESHKPSTTKILLGGGNHREGP